MRALWPLVWCIACTPDPEPAPSGWTPAPDLAWDLPDDRPELTHPYLSQHPRLADLSRFADAVSGTNRPSPNERGVFAVGNGKVAATSGLVDPMNTLHGMVGPTYQRQRKFVGDTSLHLMIDGVEVPFEAEGIVRPRGTSVVITWGEAAGVRLTLIDFAPFPTGNGPFDVPTAIVRKVLVENDGDAATLGLRLRSVDDLVWQQGGLYTEAEAPLRFWTSQGAWAPDGDDATLNLGTVASGGTLASELAWIIADTYDGLDDQVARVEGANLDDWLTQTIDHWHAFRDKGTQIQTGDPWIDDLLDGFKTAIRVQQSSYGGVVPLNRYTNTWLRDSIGPARFYARMGLHEEALAAMTYQHACHVEKGDIGNACEAGLEPSDIPASEPDWASEGPFSGRTRAEGPSYIALGWQEVVRWTGNTAPIDARWAYLRRSVLDQEMDEGRQGWSMDETFRFAMEVALGTPIETEWNELTWSANSAFVMIPAARFMASMAETLGHSDDAQAFAERAAASQEALETHFLQPEGYFAVTANKAEGSFPPALFEDVNLKAIWSGAYAPEDPLALGNLQAVYDQIGRGDGTLFSGNHPEALDTELLRPGVLTGMLPGYTLWNLSVTGHPEAQASFHQLQRFVSPSGQVQEAQAYDENLAYQPVYDPVGVVGDLAARFRPWEGGIVADALVAHLLGAEPTGTLDAPGLRLRPRPVSAAQTLSAQALAVHGATLDLDMAWDNGWRITLHNTGTPALDVALEVPLNVWEEPTLSTEGPTGPAQLTPLPLGEWMAVFPSVRMGAGEELTFRVGGE